MVLIEILTLYLQLNLSALFLKRSQNAPECSKGEYQLKNITKNTIYFFFKLTVLDIQGK